MRYSEEPVVHYAEEIAVVHCAEETAADYAVASIRGSLAKNNRGASPEGIVGTGTSSTGEAQDWGKPWR